jgi:hypothetical protein
MELEIYWIIIGVSIVFMLGAVLAYIQSPINKAKLMRRLRKKNYGVIGLLTKGKSIVYFVQDLSAPIYKCRELVLDPQKQNPYSVYQSDEVPIMFYYDTDSNPIVLETTVDEGNLNIHEDDEGNLILPHQAVPLLVHPGLRADVDKFHSDPNALNAAFDAYSELLRKGLAFKMQMFMFLLIGACAVGAISAFFSYTAGGRFDEIIKELAAIKAAIATVKPPVA